MGKRCLKLSCLLFSTIPLWACSAVPENHYFTMSYTLLPVKWVAGTSEGKTLRVRDLEIGPAYDTERIVYRYSPYEFQYYNFMLWATKPQKMLTDMIVKHLRHERIFNDVAREFQEREPDYELSGVVLAVEELDSGDKWFAHLAFSLRMTRYRGEQEVWSYDANVKKQVYNKAPVYVVKALSELMEDQMQKISAQLVKFLRGADKREAVK
jgi:ABC-type uncharacterized transport system auxiliary subunit